MKKIFVVKTYADFDVPIICGIFTDDTNILSAIKKDINKNTFLKNVKITEVEKGKFKRSDTRNGEEYDYWVESVKINSIF